MCLWWVVSEPYYSQLARSVCVSLSAFFHLSSFCLFRQGNFGYFYMF